MMRVLQDDGPEDSVSLVIYLETKAFECIIFGFFTFDECAERQVEEIGKAWLSPFIRKAKR